ncbi:imidazole glycerol phosphate synthase subunit HisH [Paracoccus sp. (in: a-proteobacteria)]|uniref:imidazole glycerol phosphate synthase subunit HisH n=1 Tax=Paracoccus sp. TaxID=267 RepID=UPI0026DF5032|nr:imidazole glycerol phosphate synthase subunit HisH [Paracoccus sp. (in: a-proteobacteria)]MDO5371226.1 imidazole glycerol phosphate synthase subunit HisH [Paracoccus sp. (in: a-proteobacteria)]
MRVALIDYESGNLHSAAKAVALVGAKRGAEVEVTSDPDVVACADRIVLPGDGAFPACRAAFDAVPGLHEALEQAVRQRGIPFLGICVGMQMLADEGLEYRPTPGFGWIGGRVERIMPDDPSLKVPHMGWNDLILHRPHAVLDGVPSGGHAYFVHSWHFVTERPEDLVASVDYGGPVTAVVARDNILGLQFHPEKSQALGLRILGNFLDWKP